MSIIGRKLGSDIHTVFTKMNNNVRKAFNKYHPIRKINNTLHEINEYAQPLAGVPLIGEVVSPLRIAENISKVGKLFEDSYVNHHRRPQLER
jgi:hypothetical protein